MLETYWPVHVIDGGGRGKSVVANFVNRSDAEKLCKESGYYRIGEETLDLRHTFIQTPESIYVFKSFKEYKDCSTKEFRQKALDKLTPEERWALGV